ncbi:GNAT family N-acetyltransferase [Bradyrhizobium prioriisuperbiae]|uniref:GNAT family N-acetyltransferase n=1 Tax=Bradyrhizobium prioriisuperbiae TaxID=2854389 RepID=UPI0028E8EF84|nr:GNAT family N-acetyltransferase [Bradyrhizobium prioritasuperba]
MRLETPRLILRPWQDGDRASFAAINADAEVRRYYYPSTLSTAETNDLIDAEIDQLRQNGFGFLAVQRELDGALIGGAGLSRPGPEVPGSHEAEIGWILGRAYWRQGYATELAASLFDVAWTRLHLAEVIGYTSNINLPSQRAMEKVGMSYVPGADFNDTTVPVGHILRPHLLYRIVNPLKR